MKFVITYSTGEYSDHHTENILVCDTEEQAKAMAEDFNNRLKHFGLHWDQEDLPEFAGNKGYHYFSAQEDLFRKETEAVLGRIRIDYTGGTFSVDKVREIHDRPHGYKEPDSE